MGQPLSQRNLSTSKFLFLAAHFVADTFQGQLCSFRYFKNPKWPFFAAFAIRPESYFNSSFCKKQYSMAWILYKHSQARMNSKINPDVAFKHLFPRANALMTNRSSLDFVGQVHNLQKDWHTMQQVCGVPSNSRRTLVSNLGQHESTKDPKGVKASSFGFIRKNPAAHLSVCLLYVRDYVEIHTSPKGLPASCSTYVKDCLTR